MWKSKARKEQELRDAAIRIRLAMRKSRRVLKSCKDVEMLRRGYNWATAAVVREIDATPVCAARKLELNRICIKRLLKIYSASLMNTLEYKVVL
jgi:hypothetical protein